MSTLRTQMIQDLQIVGLSERTQEAYVRSVRKLAEHYRQAPDQLSEKQVREYFLFLRNDRQFASATLKMAFYGIRFFYTHTVPREWATLEKFRVAKEKKLPDVLTVDEVRRLIDAVRTLHNKTYLWTVYSLGLRLNEGLHLQVGDVDGARMMVHVHRGKRSPTSGSSERIDSDGRAGSGMISGNRPTLSTTLELLTVGESLRFGGGTNGKSNEDRETRQTIAVGVEGNWLPTIRRLPA